MTQFFTTSETARRYEVFRPKVHPIIIEWLKQNGVAKRFSRAIDVACGTGDSTLPLLGFCDSVLAIDSSDEMIALARSKGIDAHIMDYTGLPKLGRFDLITTCMAFHWFDPQKAISAYKNASQGGAIWLIYNFSFAGHTSSQAFNDWLRHSYLKRYPSPPRNRIADVAPDDDVDIELLGKARGTLPLEFTAQTLVGYLSTQSNIEAAVRNGHRYDLITASLLSELENIDLSGEFSYAYSYEILRYVGSPQRNAVDASGAADFYY